MSIWAAARSGAARYCSVASLEDNPIYRKCYLCKILLLAAFEAILDVGKPILSHGNPRNLSATGIRMTLRCTDPISPIGDPIEGGFCSRRDRQGPSEMLLLHSTDKA